MPSMTSERALERHLRSAKVAPRAALPNRFKPVARGWFADSAIRGTDRRRELFPELFRPKTTVRGRMEISVLVSKARKFSRWMDVIGTCAPSSGVKSGRGRCEMLAAKRQHTSQLKSWIVRSSRELRDSRWRAASMAVEPFVVDNVCRYAVRICYPTSSTSLPSFSPVNSRANASGNCSMPGTTVSR